MTAPPRHDLPDPDVKAPLDFKSAVERVAQARCVIQVAAVNLHHVQIGQDGLTPHRIVELSTLRVATL